MKKAFTTAELLLAMTIIGVIASLVIPPLLRDYNNKVYSASIKKIYTDIQNAVSQASLDENVDSFNRTKYWSNNYYKKGEFLEKYFKGQMNKYRFASSYESISGESAGFNVTNQRYILLKNGAMICYYGKDDKGVLFYVDTNGTNPPNKGGYDMFHIVLGEDGTLKTSSNPEGDIACKTSAVGKNCLNELIENDWDIDKY